MKVYLIYFSQTNNTRSVAEAIAESLEQQGAVTQMVPLKKANELEVIDADLLGIGTACFSSQAPTPVKRFLKTLPRLDQKKAFVFATSGSAPGRVLSDLAHLLRRKGADVIGGFLTYGEVHHPAPCLLGRMANRPDTQDLAQARRFAEAVFEHIAKGRTGVVAASRPEIDHPKWGFYDFVALISSDSVLRLLLPKPRLNENQCKQCQWCVSECPMNAIVMDAYPRIGDQCIRCYHCFNGCPQKAFQVNWVPSNLVVSLFYNKTFARWFGELKPDS